MMKLHLRISTLLLIQLLFLSHLSLEDGTGNYNPITFRVDIF